MTRHHALSTCAEAGPNLRFHAEILTNRAGSTRPDLRNDGYFLLRIDRDLSNLCTALLIVPVRSIRGREHVISAPLQYRTFGGAVQELNDNWIGRCFDALRRSVGDDFTEVQHGHPGCDMECAVH